MNRKTLLLIIALLCLWSLSGCLEVETILVRILFDDIGSPDKIAILYYNFSSDEDTPEKVEADFKSLLELCIGEDNESERASQGITVTHQELFIENGHICGREQGTVHEADVFFNEMQLFRSGPERILLFETSQEQIVETNGTILKTKHNAVIVWPASEKEIYWKMKSLKNTENFESNLSTMATLFKKYLENEARQTPPINVTPPEGAQVRPQ